MEKENRVLPYATVKADWQTALLSNKPIRCAYDALDLVARDLIGLAKEIGIALFLDCRQCPICISMVGSGDQTSTEFNPRDIVQMGLLCNATNVVLVHNHPGNHADNLNLHPSKADLETAKDIADLLRRVGMNLNDSIIVSSFCKEGRQLPAYYSIKQKRAAILKEDPPVKNPLLSLPSIIEKGIQWNTGDAIPEFWSENIKSAGFFRTALTWEEYRTAIENYKNGEYE